MSITAKAKNTDYEPTPEGLHHAICIGVFDIGTHTITSVQYGSRDVHGVIFMWELPDERIEIDGKNLPRAISAEYTLSISKKSKLRPILESWRGRKFSDTEADGFDVTKVLGANCTLQVMHDKKNDNTYARVSNVIPLMKGTPKKEPENPLRTFSFETDTEVPDNIPEWIANKIKSAQEWGTGKSIDQINREFNDALPEDDIPF